MCRCSMACNLEIECTLCATVLLLQVGLGVRLVNYNIAHYNTLNCQVMNVNVCNYEAEVCFP